MKGFTQGMGIDYPEIFSLAVKMTTIRALLADTVKRGWKIYQFDVNIAFIHVDFHEEVYMKVPPSLTVEKPGLVCELNKSFMA